MRSYQTRFHTFSTFDGPKVHQPNCQLNINILFLACLISLLAQMQKRTQIETCDYKSDLAWSTIGWHLVKNSTKQTSAIQPWSGMAHDNRLLFRSCLASKSTSSFCKGPFIFCKRKPEKMAKPMGQGFDGLKGLLKPLVGRTSTYSSESKNTAPSLEVPYTRPKPFHLFLFLFILKFYIPYIQLTVYRRTAITHY